ncbi:Aste57867_717 [Aphanomyces stellatus]|uniref:Aste57867_717 protein n=1 Tax=Aphanomyces stellatus TaxID=120398 RepID=A0A485K4H8_9STRA|nr:hypothetical protein As57867_000716 [Aphanomyces stellatus]VFT77941.1 Aste57867_717 [Aphanomyces stellatus]
MSSATPPFVPPIAADNNTVEPAKTELDKLEQLLMDVEVEPELTKDQYIDILTERLNRRNVLIDVIRRAYYHDVVVVKEGLLAKEAGGSDERVAALPSVDLRDTLPLFAPSETFLRVHQCEKCGGTVELVHGETRELNDARTQCNRALKAEQHMKGIVHRLRGELKDATEISEALHQRIRALIKENAFTLEQLQVARKAERDQKSTLAELKSKLQHATATNESIAKLTHQVKELNMELEQATKQKLHAVSAHEDLQDEFDALQTAYNTEKQERTRLDVELGATRTHYEESKTHGAYLSTELNLLMEKHKIQVEVDEILQTALSKVKEELASLTTRSEQTKRQLEDQLMTEEVAREETQEKFIEEKKRNKQMQRDMEAAQREADEYQEQFNALLLKRDLELGANQAAFDAQLSTVLTTKERLREQVEVLGMWENEWLSQLRSRVCDNDDDDEDDDNDDDNDDEQSGDESQDLSARDDDDGASQEGSDDDEEEKLAAVEPRTLTPSAGSTPARRVSSVPHPAETAAAVAEALAHVDADDAGSERSRKHRRTTVVRKATNSSSTNEVAAMAKEVDELKDKLKQQKHKLHDVEKILTSTKASLTEMTISNQVLQGSLHDMALKASEANQSETQTTSALRDAREQVDLVAKDLGREGRKVVALELLLSQIGTEIYYIGEDPYCITPVIIAPVPDTPDDHGNLKYVAGCSDDVGDDVGDDVDDRNGMTQDMLAKKQAIKQQLYLDQVVNNYISAHSERVDIYCGNIKRAQEGLLELAHDLKLAKRKIENQMSMLEKEAMENGTLRHELETEKMALAKLDRVVKITVAELNDVNEKMRLQKKMVEEVDVERNKLQEEKRKIAFMMMEKSKTLDREIDLNEQLTQKVRAVEAELARTNDAKNELAAELQVFVDGIAFRKATNQDVGVSVQPAMRDAEMQSDKWKPQGLVLRQRNNPDMVPQRYEGPPTVMVACPSLDTLLKEKPLMLFQQTRETANDAAAADEARPKTTTASDGRPAHTKNEAKQYIRELAQSKLE